jgi:SAM-dependent methyltransferase
MSAALSETFFKTIRLYELTKVSELVNSFGYNSPRILDLGAGAGWQASELSKLGFRVSAIDIPTSNHQSTRIWPVIDFDGCNIPFPDAEFDIVYSSNVLEHVVNLTQLNDDIHRVLRPGGRVIHYLPTPAWRAWSLVAFYPSLAYDVWRRLLPINRYAPNKPNSQLLHGNASFSLENGYSSFYRKLLYRLVPHAHGAQGTFWTELFRFSRSSWDYYFKMAGWEVETYQQNCIFLTGEMLIGNLLPVSSRSFLSNFLGSTAHLYALKSLNLND